MFELIKDELYGEKKQMDGIHWLIDSSKAVLTLKIMSWISTILILKRCK